MCDEFFNLENRLVFGFRQHLLVILGGEMSLEAMDTAQVNFAASNHGEKDWEASSRARGADALAGCRLGHVIPRHEEGEHGRVPQLGPQLAPIDRVDVAEQVGIALVILSHQDTEPREQNVIVQCFERVIGDHDLFRTCVFEALGSPFPVGAVRCRVVRC